MGFGHSPQELPARSDGSAGNADHSAQPAASDSSVANTYVKESWGWCGVRSHPRAVIALSDQFRMSDCALVSGRVAWRAPLRA